MNTIVILIPYFGKWPEWIDIYFYSCSRNTLIDWHFFTDCTMPTKHYDNIYIHPVSFEAYCKQVSCMLQIDFSPQSPYKLCDLRPFFGYIHSDLITGYDFWGFGDIDIVWGDIRRFYTDTLLSKYDVFSTHADRLSGHLSILRNNKKYTELAFSIDCWQKKLETQTHYGLDENDFSHLIYPASRYIKKIYSKIIRRLFNWRDAWVIYYSIMPIINYLLFIKQRGLYFKEQHTTPILYNDRLSCKYDSDTWYYKNGTVINGKTGNEHIYVHFMVYKKNSFRSDYFWEKIFYSVPQKNFTATTIIINKKGISVATE